MINAEAVTKSETTRQFIIERSAPIFNTKGIAGTAMSDIMRVTKMAKGGLYGHFESKEELSHAIVDYNLAKLATAVQQAVENAGTAKDKLFAFLDVFKNPMHFPVEGGCPVLNFGAEADDTSHVINEKVRKLIRSAQNKAAVIIKKGIKSGEFKESFDAEAFSILMFTVIEGGTLIGRVLKTDKQMGIVIGMLKQQIGDQVC